MSKVTKKDFETFKETFKLWQDRFDCNQWYVTFNQKSIEGCDGQIVRGEMETATVTCAATTQTKFDPEGTAFHEALHLLLGKLVEHAKGRFSSESEIDTEEERVVRILEKWIKNA